MSRAEWNLMAAAYVCLGSMALMGCVATPDRSSGMDFATSSARNTQLALTGLMAVDTAQTVTIARSPDCLSEGNQVAAYAFGSRNPSPERVLITNALYIAGHWALGSYLDRKANQPVDLSIDAETDVARKSRWQVLQRVYQFATGFGHAFAIKRNAQLGIKPFSTFKCQ